MPAPRKRLPADEAKSRILEAAAERLHAQGPQNLTLATLAKDLGVSHQAILHHFGTREGLVAEVLDLALQRLQQELEQQLRAMAETDERSAEALLARAFDVLVAQGYGRLLAWIALGPDEALELHAERQPIAALARLAHSIRVERHPEADYRDTLYAVVLGAYTALASSVFERGVMRGAGIDDPATFRTWVAQLISRQLDQG